MKSEQNIVSTICLVSAVLLMVYLFAASRTDPSLRIAALVAGTGLVSSLGSIASTILTGKDVTKKADDTNSTTLTNSTTIETPKGSL